LFKRIIQLLLLFTWFALTSPALAQVWPIERVTPANNSIAVDRSSAVSVAFSEADGCSIDRLQHHFSCTARKAAE
jgi:hypothetical protein